MNQNQNASREIDEGEVRAMIASLKAQGTTEETIPRILEGMGIPRTQAESIVKQESNKKQNTSQAAVQKNIEEKNVIASQHGIKPEDVGDFFEVPKETLELPSKGIWYPNKKSTVTIKHLTATDDDILFDTSLIEKNEQLSVILESSIVDKDIDPKGLLTCDRNFLLIKLRITGLGDEYETGLRQCPHCSHIYNSTVNLSELDMKPIKEQPDEMGWFSMDMQNLKAKIKFRLLNGHDELRMNKRAFSMKQSGKLNIKNTLKEKYLLHIMEVNGKTDKVYIQSYINAMPMMDSRDFRKRLLEVEPGLDMNYDFKCPSCNGIDRKPVPMSLKLFYPDLDV